MEKINKSYNDTPEEQKSGLANKALFFDIKEVLNFVWDVGKTLFFVILVAFVIRFYLIQPFYVEGQSMEPNFVNGEYLLIDELSYHFRQPERGDIIVFRPPINTYQNYIKRIIAKPGEEIIFNNIEQGGFSIKKDERSGSKKLNEDYLSVDTITRGEKNIKLDERNYFVMGDNRSASSDSRVFGPVFRKNITGKVWFFIKLEPWKKISLFNFQITIPKIKEMGRIKAPSYEIDL